MKCYEIEGEVLLYYMNVAIAALATFIAVVTCLQQS